MKKKEIIEILKWVAISGGLVGGTGHLKDWANVLFAPLTDETKRIRFNQQTIIYNQHVEQYQREGKTLDEAIELANEH